MVRSSRLLHPQREVAPLDFASTLILAREGPDGPQMLLTRRSANARFGANAWVFPGGRVDEADGAARLQSMILARAAQDPAQRRDAVAAIRETFEEMGVLLAEDSEGRLVRDENMRGLDRSPDENLAAQIEARGWRLRVDLMRPLARWITNREIPRRFDTMFFVARMPEGQTPLADNTEQFDPTWMDAQTALAAHERGDMFLMYPTVRTLERTRHCKSVDELLAMAGDGEPAWSSCPRSALLEGRRHMLDDQSLALGEAALVSPDGQCVHAIDWQSERAVPLLRHLMRLTAPNPGRMTGPGTNTWILGTPEDGYIVIDPGPPDESHVARIADIVGTELRHIVCTHSHPDHSPGARMLSDRTGIPVRGMASASTSRVNSRFVPDIPMKDGDTITVGDTTLRAVHTPGHAANHLCLLAEEDRLLFSGDHILNGSTTVIDPPDGDMLDYLDSLERLRALDAQFILPAHGHVISEPAKEIDRLRAHRLHRESLVMDAVRAHPGRTPAELVPIVYAGTPRALFPVAERSLLAHLEKLGREGRIVARDQERWFELPPA